jgi:prephenate dehydrogenase
MAHIVHRLAIIGVGLIGGSLARAVKRHGLAREIVGSGRDRGQLEKAVDLGVIDRYELDIAAAVGDADMVVVAVPVGAMEAVFRRMRGALRADAVLTDVGSVKSSVIASARAVFGELPGGFVPGHPIAGTERSGVEASFAELYQNRCVILTPLDTTRPEATAAVREIWARVGAEVVEMDARRHDEVLAATSHLPHMLAYTLVDTLARMEEHTEIFRYAAGGFRDFTRIASSDPVMWRDIGIANRDALLTMLDRYRDDLGRLAELIRAGQGDELEAMFARAKAARDRYAQRNDKNTRTQE